MLNALCESRQIPDQNTASGKIDFIVLAQIIEYRGYSLPAGTGIIGNVLLGKRVLE
jgi:hypothetical protein